MSDRLVNTSIAILLSLPHTGLNVNRIITQTSSDRSHVLLAIKLLKKANLVNKEKDPNHKQGRIIRLTHLGIELQKVANGIKKYSHFFSVLDGTVKERFHLSLPTKGVMQDNTMHLTNDKETIRRFLREGGYSQFETERYIKEDMPTTSAVRKLLIQSPRFVISILVFKYNFLLQFNPNEQARPIIRSIMINSINSVMNGIRTSHANMTDEILNLCVAISQIGVFNNSSMNDQIHDLLRSIFWVLGPNKERLQEFVRSPLVQRELLARTDNIKLFHGRTWLHHILPLLTEQINDTD